MAGQLKERYFIGDCQKGRDKNKIKSIAVEGIVIDAISPYSSHLPALVFDHPRTVLHIFSVLTAEVEHPVYVWLPWRVFPSALTHVVLEPALKTISVGELKNTVAVHQVFLELASIDA